MPKIQSRSVVVVAVNEKGWMVLEMMNVWLRKCCTERPDDLKKTQSHACKAKLKVFNSIPAIIPGGLTKVLQPLDISVNQSLKAVLRHG